MRRQIRLEKKVVSENDRRAKELAERFRAAGILAVNLMISPGAGKTSLLEETSRRLGGELRLAAIEGDLATDRDARHLPELVKRLKDPDSAVRYWAATGCVVLGEQARSAADALAAALADPSGDVRIAAAEALFGLGTTDKAIPVLREALADKNPRVALHAVNVIQCLGEKAAALLPAVERAMKDSGDNYVNRAGAHVLETLGKNSSGPG
jgi:HEAT repeat protein